MDKETQIADQIKMYQDMAKADPGIDVGKLTAKLLESSAQQDNNVSDKQRKWGYVVSLLFPPFGLLFAVKFYLSDKDDGKKTALVCAALTVLAFILAWIVIKSMVSSLGGAMPSGGNIQDIEQINIEDYKDLYQK